MHEPDKDVSLTVVGHTLTEFAMDDENPQSAFLLRNDRYDRVKILLALTHATDLYSFLRNYWNNFTPYNLKDVDIYLIVDTEFGRKMLSKEFKKSAVMNCWLQTFETEEVCSLPCKAFFPNITLVYYTRFFRSFKT